MQLENEKTKNQKERKKLAKIKKKFEFNFWIYWNWNWNPKIKNKYWNIEIKSKLNNKNKNKITRIKISHFPIANHIIMNIISLSCTIQNYKNCQLYIKQFNCIHEIKLLHFISFFVVTTFLICLFKYVIYVTNWKWKRKTYCCCYYYIA